jgi:hypothetical protein
MMGATENFAATTAPPKFAMNERPHRANVSGIRDDLEIESAH